MYIIFTILASMMQIFRHYEQKKLSSKFDNITVILARFLLPLPLAIFWIFYNFKYFTIKFLLLSIIVAILQILGGLLLIKSFRKKNFAVSIALTHTEVLQAALIGYCFFAVNVNLLMLIAILIIVGGVFLLINVKFSKNLFEKEGLFAILAGTIYAIQAFIMKNASQQFILDNNKFSIYYAALTLLAMAIFVQNLILITMQVFSGKIDSLIKLFSQEDRFSFIRTSSLSFLCSVLWYISYSIGNAVIIKAVSQIEILLAMVISHHNLQEKLSNKELSGVFMLSVGIVLLLAFSKI
jgi:drug/metabolite transporter (DMT)-like permease